MPVSRSVTRACPFSMRKRPSCSSTTVHPALKTSSICGRSSTTRRLPIWRRKRRVSPGFRRTAFRRMRKMSRSCRRACGLSPSFSKLSTIRASLRSGSCLPASARAPASSASSPRAIRAGTVGSPPSPAACWGLKGDCAAIAGPWRGRRCSSGVATLTFMFPKPASARPRKSSVS